ncbi:GNAT family N-acetyltransferase [Pseudomonas aeruginosa]
MSDHPISEQQLIEDFFPQVFESEAKGLLQDLMVQPTLMVHFLSITEQQAEQCWAFIKGIFEECYRQGGLKVALSHQDGVLHGYALLMEHPDPVYSRYLHKIHVFEQFRGNGIGSKMLSMVLEGGRPVSLLCSSDLVPFYERAGMHYMGRFPAPEAQHGFAMTRGMYLELELMGSSEGGGMAPVFMLNDNDVKQLLEILAS